MNNNLKYVPWEDVYKRIEKNKFNTHTTRTVTTWSWRHLSFNKLIQHRNLSQKFSYLSFNDVQTILPDGKSIDLRIQNICSRLKENFFPL